MNYKIEVTDFLTEDIDFIRTRFGSYRDGTAYLQLTGWTLIDDMLGVWEKRALTARVIKVPEDGQAILDLEHKQMHIQYRALAFVNLVKGCFGVKDVSDQYVLETFEMLQDKYKELIK